MNNKKAVSLMVSYTLLVIIALGLSVLVYGYLKIYLPSQRPECPQAISLVIDNALCDITSETLTIRLSNRGLFNVSAAFIRMGEAGRVVRQQVNEGREIFEPSPIAPSSVPRIYSYDISEILVGSSSTEFELEVQPAMLEKRALYPCEEAIVTRSISCEEAGSCSTNQECEDGLNSLEG